MIARVQYIVITRVQYIVIARVQYIVITRVQYIVITRVQYIVIARSAVHCESRVQYIMFLNKTLKNVWFVFISAVQEASDSGLCLKS